MGPPPPPYVMTTPQMTPVSPAGRSAMSAVQSPSIRSYNSPSISGYNYVPRQVIKELCHTLHVLTILHFVLSLGPRFYFFVVVPFYSECPYSDPMDNFWLLRKF